MTLLLQYSESAPEQLLGQAKTIPDITSALAALGVRFERWNASQELPDDSSAESILAAYASDIGRLKTERGYRTADVVRLKRDAQDAQWSAKAQAARGKFLDEHTHSEDEVRFFVEGSGMFCLHLQGKVTLVVCERGDLLSVPAGTRHWFDMGTEPAFCAIRVFGNETGWAAAFTGDKLASDFPSFDAVKQQYL
ncbi:MAG: putative 1,2-dihydroxy-3-keto-5-methylthiopentene dioxygenase [Pseudomonadota bacterium]|jgi:1,2-dihydroxy-3-keto-5-methylthiopentene dioxygenase